MHKKSNSIILFNGHNLNQWEGDKNLWHIDSSGAVTAGQVNIRSKQNDFLSTKQNFKDYILNLDFKMEGDTGFVNSGVQVHSQRLTVPPLIEMTGYQVDMGTGFWACIYDESRQNTIIAKADGGLVKSVLKEQDWNHYEIRCSGSCFIKRGSGRRNGVQTRDYTELLNGYPAKRKIALQIHGNCNMKVSFKNITLKI